MNEPIHIGLFYSYGPHFVKTARRLRATHEHARITVFVPARFPTELLDSLDVACVPVLPDPSRRPGLREILTVLRAVRHARLDLFAVLFDSPKLQCISAFSGARQRHCYRLDGTVSDVRLTFAGSLARAFLRGLKGRLQYGYIWLHVHCTRVKKEGARAGNSNDVRVDRDI